MLTGVAAVTVDTGVVVIVVAVAAVLIVVLVTGSMRGRQRRTARRVEARHDLDDAEERVQRAEHERDVALEGEHDRHKDR